MATVIAPSVFLGERPARPGQRRFQAAGRNVERLREGPVDERPLRLNPQVSLGELASLIEESAGTSVTLLGADLPPRLQGRLPLSLLRRRADRCGKRLRLIPHCRELRRIAQNAGLETVAVRPPSGHSGVSPGGTDRTIRASRSPAITFPVAGPGVFRPLGSWGSWAPGARLRPMALSVVAAVVSLVMAWAAVPSASLRITAAPEAWSVDLPIEVDPGIKRADVPAGRLPGRTISKEVAETAQIPTTGRRVVPDARATGQVVFINKSDKPVTVARGTIVLAGGTRFTTTEDVNIGPAIAAGAQQRVGMGRVGVVAAAGGPSSNVERFGINKTEGALGAILDVQNDSPTRGGTERTISHVTAEDRRRLQESLQRMLTERLWQQIRSQLPSGEKETAVAWEGQNPTVVEAVFNKNVDDEAQSLSLSMKLRYGVTVFQNEAYNDLVRQMAVERLGRQRQGFTVLPDTLKPEPPGVATVEGGKVRLSGRASATVQPRLDGGELRRALAGRSTADARAYLDGLPGLAGYELESWPGWLGRLPWLGLRISVGVER